MQTKLLAETVRELALIRAEVDGLVLGLKGARPQGETLARVLYLKSRFEALKITARAFEAEAMANEVAFRERTNRNHDEDRDLMTVEDCSRAREILAIFGLGSAPGSTQQDVGVKN